MIKKLLWYLFVYDLNDAAIKPAGHTRMSWKTRVLKDLSFIALGAYIFLIFNSVIPVFADVLAHTFWKKEHLASEHRLYGKNHVGLEISKMDKQAAKDKGSTSSKTSEDFSHILQFENHAKPMPVNSISINHPPYRAAYPEYDLDKDHPPPRS